MTTEEVINILQNIDTQCQNDCPVSREDCAKQENKCLVSEALKYAVDFLSADAIKVVRCKDCIHRNKWGECENIRGEYNRDCDYYVDTNFYCANGERKETE